MNRLNEFSCIHCVHPNSTDYNTCRIGRCFPISWYIVVSCILSYSILWYRTMTNQISILQKDDWAQYCVQFTWVINSTNSLQHVVGWPTRYDNYRNFLYIGYHQIGKRLLSDFGLDLLSPLDSNCFLELHLKVSNHNKQTVQWQWKWTLYERWQMNLKNKTQFLERN